MWFLGRQHQGQDRLGKAGLLLGCVSPLDARVLAWRAATSCSPFLRGAYWEVMEKLCPLVMLLPAGSPEASACLPLGAGPSVTAQGGCRDAEV